MTSEDKAVHPSLGAPKKLVIDRARWNHGTGDGVMRDEAGNMCVLGFWAVACGAEPDDLVGVHSPFELYNLVGFETPLMLIEGSGGKGDSPYAADLMETNDSDSELDSDRERMIVLGFRGVGVEVEYVGEYQDPGLDYPEDE